MRILFIRHGDPDYINDTLTKKGHREAKLLAERAADLNLGSCYVSPLGRAKDVGRILRTFKIKKNVEVTDNGKDNF